MGGQGRKTGHERATCRRVGVRALVIVVGALLTILTSLVVVPVGTASAQTVTGWTVNHEYPAVPGTWAVACPSTTTCYAVGHNSTSSADILATTDGGATWTNQTVPSGVASLDAVACPSPATCYAVGFGGGSYDGVIVATTDGGTTWRSQSTPVGGDDTSGYLSGVACPSTTTCYAVGSDEGTSTADILATTNGGATWMAQVPAAQEVNQARSLAAVACSSVADCLAVGSDGLLSTTDGGTTWNNEDDLLGVALGGEPDGVACPSATTCYVVAGGTSKNIVVTTDGGTTWTVRTLSSPTSLTGVACPSTTECFAVAGTGSIASPHSAFLAATTDGATTWDTATLPGGLDGLFGVACASTDECDAVGVTSPSGDGVVIATTDAGATWTDETLPAGVAHLFGITCPSASHCYALGYNSFDYSDFSSTQDTVILGSTDGGETWTRQGVPPGTDALQGIACPSATTCFGVGYNQALGDASVITTSDAGATWTSQTVPAGIGDLDSIACPSTTTCFAVGQNFSPSSVAVIVATTDGGVTWSNQSVPAFTAQLNGVACPSTTMCVAVGTPASFYGQGVMVVTTDGGTTWNLQGSGGENYLAAVACPSTSDCYAVGYSDLNPQTGIVFATTDGGTTWNSQTTTGTRLAAVACVSPSTCDAVGNGIALGTTDSGASWSDETVPAGGLALSGIACVSVGHCLAVGVGTGGVGGVILAGPHPLIETTTAVSATPSTVAGGQSVSYSATVASTSGTGTPSGTVTFTIGTTDICTATLSAGSGSCTSTQAPLGTDSVTGTYTGDSSFAASSAGTTEVVGTTATVVSVNPSTATAGQVVTYSVAVVSGSGSGTPTGTVAITIGSTAICTATLSGGTGSCTSGAAPFGSDIVTGSYSPDVDFLASSGTTDLTVAPTTTTVSVNPTDVSAGQSVTYSATVASTLGSGTPTGTVVFTIGEFTLCTATMSGGTGSCTSSSAGGGTDTVTGTYSGDSDFASSSASAPLTVTAIASVTTVSVNPSPVAAGESVTYVAAVTPNAATVTAFGTVAFTIGSTAICTARLSAGAGSCTSDQAPQGSDTVTGSYSGDASVLASSGTAPLTVAPTVTTTVAADPAPAVFGQTVTYSATEAPVSGPGTPTGTVAFTIGYTVLCTATLAGGTGSCTATAAPVGSDTVTGTYGGDANFAASFGTTALTVTPAPTTVALQVNPSAAERGQTVIYSTTVSTTTGSGTPTGTLTFSIGATTICSATLSGGGGACQTAASPVGMDTVTATYSGDPTHAGSSADADLTVWTPGGTVIQSNAGLVGNDVEHVSGTGWTGGADTSVKIYECAATVFTPTAPCRAVLATATVHTAGARTGDFSASVTVTVGAIGTSGVTCGLALSGTCDLVVLGSSGDSTAGRLSFNLPSAGAARTTGVVDNEVDRITTRGFPAGDPVQAEECDGGVVSSNLSADCDAATAIVGHAGADGTVRFVPRGVEMLVGPGYSDTALGTCAPGGICDVVVTDQTNAAIVLKIPVSLAPIAHGHSDHRGRR